jgi:hypothetical protein
MSGEDTPLERWDGAGGLEGDRGVRYDDSLRRTEHDIEYLGVVEPQMESPWFWVFGALQLRKDAIVGFREIDRGDRRPELHVFRLYTAVGSFTFSTEKQEWWKP